MSLDLIRRISIQILQGLHLLHRKNIIHGNLNSDNVMLIEKNKSGVKIVDFSNAQKKNEKISTSNKVVYFLIQLQRI
jgi:serine/threonine protein kinase